MKKILQKLPPWTLTMVVAVAILYLTLAPQPLPEDTPQLFPGADKVAHAIMFGSLTMAILIDRLRRGNGNKMKKRWLIIAAVASIALGGAIEIIQGAMGAGRSADVLDFLADEAGAIIAVPLFVIVIEPYLSKR